MTVVRAMRPEDLASVLAIQSCCYDEAKRESRPSFLAKLNASPGTCFMGLVAGHPAGYLVAVPTEVSRPPPLHSPDYAVPRAANALYLHDLAVHPSARGAGAAAALIAAYFHVLRQSNLRFACLTAVNESGSFWERYGFGFATPVGPGSARMATYGEGARYMCLRVGADIAPAMLDDAPGIAAVHVRSWQAAYAGILDPGFLAALSIERRTAQWEDILRQQESRTLVARQAEGMAGFVSFGHSRDDCANQRQGEIWALYTKPGMWGTGIGRALLDSAVGELRSLGRRSVLLWVLGQNTCRVRFYESFGFRPVPGRSRLLELGGRQVDEVCLRLGPGA